MALRFRLAAPALAAALLAGGGAGAGEAWDSLRPMLYGERPITDGAGTIHLSAPYRASDDREVPIGATVALPDGESIRAISLIIDENPMPVSAVFELDATPGRFEVLVNMRINGPTPIRAVVETADGRLLMAETAVKTSGLGACASPPVTDVAEALETLGEMAFLPAGGAEGGDAALAMRLAALSGAGATAQGRLEIRHPSHSGMQMNQITLLHIPAHFVETVEVWQDAARIFRMTGSISLSEDPEIEFSYAPEGGPIRARMTDTKGGVFERSFGLGGS